MLFKIRLLPQIIRLVKKRGTAWVNPQPQIWNPRPKFRRAKAFKPVRLWHKTRRVAPWINPQPQNWSPRPKFRRAKPPVPIKQRLWHKTVKIAPFLPIPIYTWVPHTKHRRGKPINWPRLWHKTRRVSAWLNPQPQLWSPKPLKKHKLFSLVLHKKHVKTPIIVVAAGPTYFPFKRKKIRSPAITKRHLRQKDAAWLYTPTNIWLAPKHRRRINFIRAYPKKKKKTNTAIIGSISTIGLAQANWHWQANAATETFNIALAQQHWNWQANQPQLTFNLPITASKSWVWLPNAFTQTFNIALQRKSWVWSGRAFITNLKAGRTILAFMKTCSRFMNRF